MRLRCAFVVVCRLLLLGLISGSIACSSQAPPDIAEPDVARFAAEVYPVLLRDCAMSHCHGAEQRFFRVVGPGRVRLSKQSKPLDAATDAEIMMSYNRARSLIESGEHAGRSLLLHKPLAVAAGGANHEGIDRYGHNVYQAVSDPGYAAIAGWVLDTPELATP